MNGSMRLWVGCAGLAVAMLALGTASPALAQAKPSAPPSPAAAPAATAPAAAADAKAPAPVAAPAAQPVAPAVPAPAAPVAKAPAAAGAQAPAELPATGPFRRLAPGVMASVNPMREYQETVCRHDVVELVAVDASFDWAKKQVFRRDIWALQFKFKPMRFVWVDIPQPKGVMKRTLVRYLVYSVTNPGKVAHPVVAADGTAKLEPSDKPVHFSPQFLLESLQENDHRVYPDRVIPLAMAPIRMREDPNRTFLNSVEMNRDIAVGETVWGVATWEDVDSKIDRFAVYVTGLTNAYQWVDEPGRYKVGDPIGTGRRLVRKTLRLNFWRPGDEYFEHEDEIRFGIPGQVDYEWVYR